MDKFIIFALLAVLLSFQLVDAGYPSSAYASWFQTGNADFRLLGGQGYTVYAKNFQNPATDVSNASYTSCIPSASIYEPVSMDFNNDGFQEFVISSAHLLQMYDINCQLLNTLDFGSRTISAMPVLLNTDEDAQQEIMVLTDDFLFQFEFNTLTNNFDILSYINYSSLNPGLDLFTCPYEISGSEHSRCLAWANGYNSTWVFDITSSTVSELTGNMGTKVRYSQNNYNGIAIAKIDPSHYIAPVCYVDQGITDRFVRCPMFNASGAFMGNLTSSILSGAFTTAESKLSAFPAKLGSVQRIFISGKTGGKAFYFITDTSGINLLTVETSSEEPTPWMVGDYNKDGSNEACIRIHALNSNHFFRCYNQNLVAIIDYDLGGAAYFNNGVMADFFPDRAAMGIGDSMGITYYNSTGSLFRVYNKGIGTSGTTIVVNGATGAVPAILFTNGISESFLLVNTQFNTACGDGICADGENIFTCPSDCNMTCSGYCGDLNCDSVSPCDETAINCPSDCGAGVVPVDYFCGNGECESVKGENYNNCHADCPYNPTIPAVDYNGDGKPDSLNMPVLLVNPENVNEGILPEIYYGIISLFAYSMRSVIFLAVCMMILFVVIVIVKKVAEASG